MALVVRDDDDVDDAAPLVRSPRSLLWDARATNLGAKTRGGGGGYGTVSSGAEASKRLRVPAEFRGDAAFRAQYGASYSEGTRLLTSGLYGDLLREQAAALRPRRLPGCCYALGHPARCAVALTAAALIFLVVLGFTVLAPLFIKAAIAATTLTFTSLNISAPTAGGGGLAAALAPGANFSITVAAVLSGLEPVGGTLNPFFATLSHGGRAVATFTTPPLVAAAGAANALLIEAPVTVVDADAFVAFGADLLLADALTVTLSGTVSVTSTAVGVPITVKGVPFSKDVALAGCGGLRGATVAAFSLADSTPTQALADISVRVWNPSVVTISPLGALAADVSSGGQGLGTVFAAASELRKGWTELRFGGPLASTNTTFLSGLISDYLSNVTTVVRAVARPCAPSEAARCGGGGGGVPLFAPLLATGVVALEAALTGAPVPLLRGVLVKGMYLAPRGAREVGLALNITVLVSALLGFNSPVTVKELGLNCSLVGEVGLNDLRVLGALRVPTTPLNATAQRVGGGGVARGGDPASDLLGVSASLAAALNITDSDPSFASFVQYFLSSPAVGMRLTSAPGVAAATALVGLDSALGFLRVTVPLDITTVVEGIGGFPGVTVEDFQVLGVAAEDPAAVAVSLSVGLYNPSPATFPLGVNATLGVRFNGALLGTAVVFNTTLVPGNNSLRDALGLLAPAPSALPAASALFSGYLAGAPSDITVVGLDVSLGDGVEVPRWLLQAVRSLEIPAVLPGLPPAQAAALLANTTLESLVLNLYDSDAGAFFERPVVSGVVRTVLQLPFSLPVGRVGTVNMSLAFVDVDTGELLATLNATQQAASWVACNTSDACALSAPPARADVRAEHAARGGRFLSPPPLGGPLQPAGVLGLFLAPTPLHVESVPGFARLVRTVLQQRTAAVRLVGAASPTAVGLPFGSVDLEGVRVDAPVAIVGMANLTSPPAKVTDGQIFNTSATSLTLTVSINVTNPSTLSGNLGPVRFGIGYGLEDPAWDWDNRGAVLVTEIPELLVGPGESLFVANGALTLPPQAVAPVARGYTLKLLSNFLSQVDTNVTLQGLNAAHGGSSASPFLQPAVEDLVVGGVFPGIPQPLVLNATIIPIIELFKPILANASLRLTNVLNVSLALQNASLTIFLCGKEELTPQGSRCLNGNYTDALGFFYKGDLDREQGGVAVPPLTTADTRPLPVTFLATDAAVGKLLDDAVEDKDIVTKVNGTVLVRLTGPGGAEPLEAEVFFEELGVPVCLFDANNCDTRRPPL